MFSFILKSFFVFNEINSNIYKNIAYSEYVYINNLTNGISIKDNKTNDIFWIFQQHVD